MGGLPFQAGSFEKYREKVLIASNPPAVFQPSDMI
jgi:hypothetical protein